VGGGSTEITVIKNREIISAKSFKVGSVRLKENKVNPEIWEEMKLWVKQNNTIENKAIAMGTGGNINKLYSMAANENGEAMSITTLKKLYTHISTIPIIDRINILKLNPDRADVIDHAAGIYISIMDWAGISQILAPNGGLKDGLIMTLWDTHKNIIR